MTPRKDELLSRAFNECCELLMAGESTAVCLDRYAEYAADLAPLLAAFVELRELRTVPPRSAEAVASSRASFMAAAEQLALARRAQPGWARLWTGLLVWWGGIRAELRDWVRGGPRLMPAGLAAAVVLFVIAGLLTTGAIAASAKALPGDRLYPVKTATEQARILLTLNTDARAMLVKDIAQERLREARAVAELQRPVATMHIAGTIEAISSDQWVVSGLPVRIGPESQISGIPEVGASVEISLTAPGDGTLVAVQAVVQPARADLREKQPASPIEPSATPTETRSRPLASPTPSTTPTLSPTLTVSGAEGAPEPLEIPTDPSIRAEPPTAMASPSATRTPTGVVTSTPTASLTVAPSPTPPREMKTSLYGWVASIEGDKWIIGDYTVFTDGNTWYFGHPGVGYEVGASVVGPRADGSYLALQMWTTRSPDATPEPIEFTGVIKEMSGDEWVISGNVVKIKEDTQIIGDPHVQDVVEFKGVRYPDGEIWASTIRVLALEEVAIEGVIERMEGDTLVVDGWVILIDSKTEISGDAAVGRYAQVLAERWPDGTLVARMIYIVPDTPTPTEIPVVVPTLTDTPISAEVLTQTSTPIPTST